MLRSTERKEKAGITPPLPCPVLSCLAGCGEQPHHGGRAQREQPGTSSGAGHVLQGRTLSTWPLQRVSLNTGQRDSRAGSFPLLILQGITLKGQDPFVSTEPQHPLPKQAGPGSLCTQHPSGRLLLLGSHVAVWPQ